MKLFNKIVIVAICCVYYLTVNITENGNQSSFRAIFLDVGQGDALLLITPDSKSILIDTGKDITAATKLGKYLPSNILDLLIITHPDSDHIAGVFDIKKGYQINNTIAERYDLLLGLEMLKVDNGAVMLVGCCVRLKFYNVDSNSLAANDRSYAILVSFGEQDIFVGGDLPKSIEDSLANQLGDIEILKVGHHGSKTSTSSYFLETTKPEFAMISVGKNSYGHPHQEVINNLNLAGVETYRTDQLGDIEVVFLNEKEFKITSK